MVILRLLPQLSPGVISDLQAVVVRDGAVSPVSLQGKPISFNNPRICCLAFHARHQELVVSRVLV
jgi:hypothetical protein